MKKLVIPEQPKTPEINWNKPQWVISKFNDIVLTTGRHDGDDFTGTCLPNQKYPNGDYATNWSKRVFKPLTFDIPFTISNSED